VNKLPADVPGSAGWHHYMMFLDHETSVGSEEEALESSAEENKVLVRRFLEAQANADPDALEELLASDFVDHSLQRDQEPGREGFIRSVAEEPAIFSNLRANIDDQVAEGCRLALFWSHCSHCHAHLRLPNTGHNIHRQPLASPQSLQNPLGESSRWVMSKRLLRTMLGENNAIQRRGCLS
jgi:hypothetical protein